MSTLLNGKSYDAILTEANDYFRSSYSGAGILNEGFKAIAYDSGLTEQYIDSLTDGASSNDAAEMAQVMRNTMDSIMQESTMTGIMPIHSLACPVIRRLWPRFVLKNAIKTQIATSPALTISYQKPYILKADAAGKPVKLYVPQAFTNKQITLGDYVGNWVDYEVGAGTATVAGSQVVDLWGAKAPVAKASAIKYQPVDEVVIYSVTYDKATPEAETAHTITLNSKCDIAGNGTAVVKFTGSDTKEGEFMILVRLDKDAGKAYVSVFATKTDDATTDILTKVVLKVHYSTEFNENAVSAGFDIERTNINIPTGEHINFNLPVEFLQDTKALYQIDGTKEATDVMSNIVSRDLDGRIHQFLQRSFTEQPGKFFPELPTGQQYITTFNVQPSLPYANTPTAWREELKSRIDHIATRIKNNTYLSNGTFSVIGNPLDVNLITNIDWAFKAGQGAVDGVDVDYAVGTYVGTNVYKVFSSPIVPQGYLYIVFIPSGDTQRTYTYFPYTFVTEGGYRDPNRMNTPSLLCTKRDALHAFLPAIGVVQILNNGETTYDPDRAYIPTRSWDAPSGTWSPDRSDGSRNDDGYVDAGDVTLGKKGK